MNDLQMRMTERYLRSTNLPDVEKARLRLFLELLLETFDQQEDSPEEAPPEVETVPPVKQGPPPEGRTVEVDNSISFPDRLRMIMDGRRLSQAKTADLIGVQQWHICSFLAGKRLAAAPTEKILRWIEHESRPLGAAPVFTASAEAEDLSSASTF